MTPADMMQKDADELAALAQRMTAEAQRLRVLEADDRDPREALESAGRFYFEMHARLGRLDETIYGRALAFLAI